MAYRDIQNPGIGGIDELTDAETLVIQSIAALADPGADRILFWDESENAYKYLTAGSGLTITGTTMTATGTVDGSGTSNEIAYWVDSDTLGALAVATYPSLTQLSYVKGVTSAIQTQLDARQPLDADLTSIAALATTAYGRGLLTLADEDALEALLDTLPNLVSIQGRTVTLADAGANAIFGWDDAAGAYENLTQAEARTVLGLGTAAYVATDLSDLNEATIESAIDTLPNLISAALLPWTGMKPGTDGEIPTFDSSGNPAFVAVGTATHVLTSNGAGTAPTFQAPASGGWALLASGTFSATTNATFTADNTTNTFTSTAHGLVDGDKITVASSGTLPTGLSAATGYYVRDKTADTFKLCATNPFAAAIDITTDGTGTLTWTNTSGSIILPFSAKNNLNIVVYSGVPTASSSLQMIVNTDGTGTYGTYGRPNDEATSADISSTTTCWKLLGGIASVREKYVNITLVNLASYRKQGQHTGMTDNNTAAVAGICYSGSVVWNNTSAQISSVTAFLTGAVGFGTGAAVYVYGAN